MNSGFLGVDPGKSALKCFLLFDNLTVRPALRGLFQGSSTPAKSFANKIYFSLKYYPQANEDKKLKSPKYNFLFVSCVQRGEFEEFRHDLST